MNARLKNATARGLLARALAAEAVVRRWRARHGERADIVNARADVGGCGVVRRDDADVRVGDAGTAPTLKQDHSAAAIRLRKARGENSRRLKPCRRRTFERVQS